MRCSPRAWTVSISASRLARSMVRTEKPSPFTFSQTGLGKSFLALDLCARLSTGQPWPDGSATAGPAAAVYLNAEDGAEDTLGPRLRTLGADPASVYLLERLPRDLPVGNKRRRPIELVKLRHDSSVGSENVSEGTSALLLPIRVPVVEPSFAKK